MIYDTRLPYGRAMALVTVLVPACVAMLAAQRSGSSIATESILESIGARAGATICEIGAGDGALSVAAARVVGPAGRVYTSELGDARIAALKEHVGKSGLAQIAVVAGEPERTNFPDGACDALFMRNVYHHFAEPATMNASIAAALKPGGRLAVVDFAPPGAEADRSADRDENGSHGVTADTVARELTAAGFAPVARETGAQRWFMVVVTKPH